MNLPRNIGINTAVRTATSIAEKAMVFVIMAVIGRRFGAQAFGIYSFVLAYVMFCRVGTDWGLNTITIRKLSTCDERQKPQVFGAVLTLRLLLAPAAAILGSGAFVLFSSSPLTKLAICIASVTLADVVTEVCAALLQAELKQTWLGILEISNRLLWCSAATVTLLAGGGVIALLIVLAASSLLQAASAIWLCRRVVTFLLHFDVALWRKLLAESWPLAAQSLMSTVYIRIDQLLLLPMAGAAAVGLYSAATKIAEVWGLAAGVFLASVFPLLCRFHGTDAVRFCRLAQHAFRYLYIAIFAVVFVVSVFGSKIIVSVFGSSFASAARPLVPLIWSEVFLVSNMMAGAILVAAGRERITFVLTAAAAVSNLALNLLLIPRWGMTGAAWASLGSYALYLVTATIIPSTRIYSRFAWSQIWRPAIACVVAVVPFVLLRRRDLPLLPVGLFIYAAVLIVLRGFGTDDWEVLRRSLSGPQPAVVGEGNGALASDSTFGAEADPCVLTVAQGTLL